MNNPISRTVIGLLVALCCSNLFAVDVFFTDGGAGSDWNNGDNWSILAVPDGPGFGDNAVVQDGLIAEITGNIPNVNELKVSFDGTDGTVNHTTGDANFGNWMGVGKGGGGTGTYNQSGGTVTAQRVELGDAIGGTASNGVYNLSGSASVSASPAAAGNDGLKVGSAANSNGLMTLTDTASAVVSADGAAFIGDNGDGTLTIGGNATFLSHGANNQAFNIGQNVDSTGEVNISGNADITSDNTFYVGHNGSGTVNQTGGSVTSGTWMSIGRNSGSVGEYNVSGTSTIDVNGGGGLEVGSELNAGAGTGTLNITGDQVSIDTVGLHVGDPFSGEGTLGFVSDSGVSTIGVVGAVSLDNANLTLDLSTYSGPNTITLVDNDDIDAVIGTFNGLAEGATILGTGFSSDPKISYIGGDGNDIVLQLASVSVAGDYNGNGIVDAADYTVWLDALGGSTLPNEGASPGIVDAADYDFWKTRFGNTSGVGVGTSIPEPASALLFIAAAIGLFSKRRK